MFSLVVSTNYILELQELTSWSWLFPITISIILCPYSFDGIIMVKVSVTNGSLLSR